MATLPSSRALNNLFFFIEWITLCTLRPIVLLLLSKVGLYQVLANYTIPILYWWKNLLYYTIPIPILYQFLGGFVHGFMFSAWDKPLQKCKGNQNFVMSSPSLWPPTPPLHSTLDQLFFSDASPKGLIPSKPTPTLISIQGGGTKN